MLTPPNKTYAPWDWMSHVPEAIKEGFAVDNETAAALLAEVQRCHALLARIAQLHTQRVQATNDLAVVINQIQTTAQERKVPGWWEKQRSG